MNYFDLPQVSNSDLSALWDAITGRVKPENIQYVYDFGNLVDAMKTEKFRISLSMCRLTLEGGQVVTFCPSDITHAQGMVKDLELDAMVKAFFDDPRVKCQYIFVRTLHIEYNGVRFTVEARCKFDGLIPGVMGADIKTTACESQKAFDQSIEFFNYDRAAAWYMDLARIDRMVFFGISKKKKNGKYMLFKFTVNRGDATYLRGRDKYSKLAFLHTFLLL